MVSLSKRAILAGVGLGYGAFVLATAPTRQFIEGVRIVRSIGHNLQAATEASADETLDYFENVYAGEVLGIHLDDE
jgi:hypothetical protein